MKKKAPVTLPEEIARFFVSMGKTTFATGAPMDRDNVKRNLKQTFLGERIQIDEIRIPREGGKCLIR